MALLGTPCNMDFTACFSASKGEVLYYKIPKVAMTSFQQCERRCPFLYDCAHIPITSYDTSEVTPFNFALLLSVALTPSCFYKNWSHPSLSRVRSLLCFFHTTLSHISNPGDGGNAPVWRECTSISLSRKEFTSIWFTARWPFHPAPSVCWTFPACTRV